MATRSATFAGWFTCGQRVEDARADVDALGGVREVAGDHVVGRQVRVLVEEVVLGDPHVLEAGLVGGLRRRSSSSMIAWCSASGSVSRRKLGT